MPVPLLLLLLGGDPLVDPLVPLLLPDMDPVDPLLLPDIEPLLLPGDVDDDDPDGEEELDELLDGEVLLLEDDGGVALLEDAELGGVVVVLVLVLVRSHAATVRAISNTDAASVACLMISPCALNGPAPLLAGWMPCRRAGGLCRSEKRNPVSFTGQMKE